MQSLPQISFIVAAYNVENYLRECLDSVISYPGTEIEIIIVDDGSTDGTGNICDEYAYKDERIHVIHQHNQGLSAARNSGIKAAKGIWLSFVDGDDLLAVQAVEKMLAHLDSEKQLLVFGAEAFCEDRIIEQWLPNDYSMDAPEEIRVYCRRVMYDDVDEKNTYGHPHNVTAWGKVFLREFVIGNRLLFPEKIRFAGDLPYTFCYTHLLKNIKFVSDCIYRYRNRQGSLTDMWHPGVIQEMDAVYEDISSTMLKFNDRSDVEFVKALHYRELLMTFRCIMSGAGHFRGGWNNSQKIRFLQELRSMAWAEEGLSAIYDKYEKKVRSFRLLETMKKRQYCLIIMRFYYYRIRDWLRAHI